MLNVGQSTDTTFTLASSRWTIPLNKNPAKLDRSYAANIHMIVEPDC